MLLKAKHADILMFQLILVQIAILIDKSTLYVRMFLIKRFHPKCRPSLNQYHDIMHTNSNYPSPHLISGCLNSILNIFNVQLTKAS